MLNAFKKKFFSSGMLGISLKEQELKMACVRVEQGKFSISTCSSFSLKENHFTAIEPKLAESPLRIATGLDVEEMVLRSLVLTLQAKNKIIKALPFQLEAILPFASDQTLASVLLKPLNTQMTETKILATTKEILKNHLQACNLVGVHPDVVTCAPMALYRIAQLLYPKQKDFLFFYLDAQRAHCIYISDGQLSLSQSIRLNEPQAEEKYASAIERLSIFLKDKGKIPENTPWGLLAESSHRNWITPLFSRFFSGEQLLEQCCDTVTPEQLHSYWLPIGYALDALISDSSSLQLLQQEFTPSHHLSLRRSRALIYAACCTGLALFTGLSTSFLLQKKTDALSGKMQTYFSSGSKTASLSQIESELQKTERSLLKEKKIFPFSPSCPKVSEVLAWLSTHPAFSTAEGAAKEGIEIKKVHYQLVSFPHLEDHSAPYQAQVELEFTATTPRLAREFHEALLKGDQMVNAKKEIKWNAQGNFYTVQFQLNKSQIL